MTREDVGALIGAGGFPTEKGTTPEPGGEARIPSDLGLDTPNRLSPSSEPLPPRRLCTTENLGHRQLGLPLRGGLDKDDGVSAPVIERSWGWPFSRRLGLPVLVAACGPDCLLFAISAG